MSIETNLITADLATIRSALRLNKLALIGIVGTPDERRALIRHAGGDIETLSVGGTLGRGTITAISEDAVMINGTRGPTRLMIPEAQRPAAAA
ncbi:hypothetical protein [Tateyamaria sp.]|uniref:hypothetical protein n=1 Tax=Tateyamaria sp. TaxID=1929288 RepID=UPI003B21388D